MTSGMISSAEARWICPPEALGFTTTAELSPAERILGQDDAVEALSFGLENRLKGNNIFVRGLSGFGRTALIHQMIEETPLAPVKSPDICYVHNFINPDQPKLISLPEGKGEALCKAMEGFAAFTTTDLPEYLNSDVVKGKQKTLLAAGQEKVKAVGKPFEEELQQASLVMVPMQVGQNMVPVILPIIDGKPIQFEALQQLRLDGKVSETEFSALVKKISEFETKFNELSEQIEAVQIEQRAVLRDFFINEATKFVKARVREIDALFNLPQVSAFLEAVMEDLIQHRLTQQAMETDFSRLYRVNLMSRRTEQSTRPVISLSTPSMANLIGKIDRQISPGGNTMLSDHLMITPGALLEADGGFLVLEAQDVLTEPGAWMTLLRTLRTGLLEISNFEMVSPWGLPQLRPEPIPIDVKVVLVGDPEIYYMLDIHESRFAGLFKVLADFSDTLPRDEHGYQSYANVVARLVKGDGLLHFSAAAVAKLIEHGARICAQQNQLTSRFGRISDVAREASFTANKAGNQLVEASHITDTIARAKRRADLPARRFRRMIAERTLRIDLMGEAVGQVNGLAVTNAGPLTYGFPTRITASVGPGSGGAVNIEKESSLSGSVHTKGFLILSGLLRYLLKLQHPLAFSASIAFEQTYGGIDGDSASGAEFCCLLSALTGLPMRQDLAMTGAIDQKGNILPIGAVTEKVEGYFDACKAANFTGTQGVIVPLANAGELMLREDVVAAIEAGQFSVYAIDSIAEALTLFMGKPAGELENSHYAPDSILAMAKAKAHAYWEITKQKPGAIDDSPDESPYVPSGKKPIQPI
jgi:lon-related putative ATP-dependent protease